MWLKSDQCTTKEFRAAQHPASSYNDGSKTVMSRPPADRNRRHPPPMPWLRFSFPAICWRLCPTHCRRGLRWNHHSSQFPTQELFGYTRAELIGQTIEILVPESYRSSITSIAQTSPNTEDSPHGSKFGSSRKTPQRLAISVEISPAQSPPKKDWLS